MSEFLGYNKEFIAEHKMEYIVNEIIKEKNSFSYVYEKVMERKHEISSFLKNIENDTRIILTGAGSSGFIGDILCTFFRNELKYNFVESIHTTDIVQNPEKYLVKDIKTLIISFGRSGDSPESIGAIEKCNEFIDNVYHLIITCNKSGKLASYNGKNVLNLVFDYLDDDSFAMTKSVTGMMTAGILTMGINNDYKDDIYKLESYVTDIIDNKYEEIQNIFSEDIKRVVILGSGLLYGTSHECALKIIELTAGKLMTWYDSPMAFRHGPKSLINENTLIIHLFSNDDYAFKYDLDMLKELNASKKYKLVGISDKYNSEAENNCDIYFYNSKDNELNYGFLGIVPIIISQIFALHSSVKLGCTPDNPFPKGEVNKVVKGVTLY